MRTPRLGLGWKEVAFSGSSPPDSISVCTCSKSGLGSSTAGDAGDAAASASSTLWWCWIRCAGSVSSGSARSWSHATAAYGRGLGGDRVPHVSVGEHEVRAVQGTERADDGWPRPPPPGHARR